MKKISVYFRSGVHPQFKEILDFPPKGIVYSTNKAIGNHNSINYRKFRVNIGRLQAITSFPRITYYFDVSKYDLIHSTRAMMPLNKMSWVVDCESAAAFMALRWELLRSPRAQKWIKKMLSSKYCKKVLPQSNAATRSIIENIDCKDFLDKVETLYLAFRTNKMKRKDSNVVRLSFIGKTFYGKGGLNVQEAFKILDKKYDVQLRMKTDVPEKHRLKMKNLIYMEEQLPKDEFYNQIFGDCDIYVQPTMKDTWGVSIAEAMSTGLPAIVTDDGFTLPELVDDGVNGFLVRTPNAWYPLRYNRALCHSRVSEVHTETVSDLIEKLSILIEDSSLRKKMGRKSFKQIESGKFSIKQRNKQLRRIYEEAIDEL